MHGHEILITDVFLWADTVGGQTPTMREELHWGVDTTHLSNHITLHREADTIRSRMARRHRHMDLMLGTMVPSPQWAEITMVSIQSSATIGTAD